MSGPVKRSSRDRSSGTAPTAPCRSVLAARKGLVRHEGSQGALSVLLDAVLTRPDDGAGHKTQKNTFRSNVVTGAASGGRFARKACGNVFVGNNLQGNG